MARRDCFFHCLNRCGDPGDVAMVNNDVDPYMLGVLHPV
jgi:hypothetical protein